MAGAGRNERLPVANSRKNLRGVLLDLLPSAPPIAKLPTPQRVIDELHVNRQLRGQPGDKGKQRLSVRLTRGVKAKHPRSFPRTNLCAIDSKQMENKQCSRRRALRPAHPPRASLRTV